MLFRSEEKEEKEEKNGSLEEGPLGMIPFPYYLIGLSRVDCLEWAVDVFAWWTCLASIDSLVGKLTRKGYIRGDTLLYLECSHHYALP